MPYSPSFWTNAAGEAAEASNLNDLETRVKAALPAFSQHTWTQKSASTALSASELNKLEARAGVNLEVLSSNPAAETNWTPIILNAISNGAQHIRLADRDYPLTTQLDLSNQPGIVFRGLASAVGAVPVNPVSRLIWKGAAGSGTGVYIHNGSNGCMFRDMVIGYDSPLYNGTLIKIDAGPSSVQVGEVAFEWCQIHATSVAAQASASAYCLLHAQDAVGGKVRHVAFGSAQHAIKGFETDTNSNPDDFTIQGCWFTSSTSGHLCNVGRYWNIKDNVFYMGGYGAVPVSPHIITSDHTSQVGARAAQFCFEGNRVWDLVNNTQVLFNQTVNDVWDASFKRNWVFPNTGSQMWKLNGPGNIWIEDNKCSFVQAGDPPIVDCGSSVTAQKDPLVIINNSWSTTTAAAASDVIDNAAGHRNVTIHGNGPSTVAVTQVEREMAHWPSNLDAHKGMVITNAHANISGMSVEGNDAGGVIVLQCNTTVSANTKLADLAFNFTGMYPDEPMTWSGSTRHKPSIQLSPIRITGRTTGTPIEIDAEVADNAQTGFSLYTRNALTGGSLKYAWAYRILMT